MFQTFYLKLSSRKFLLTLGAIAAIWVAPIPIEVKVLRTVQAVIAYVAVEGAGDVAERLGKK